MILADSHTHSLYSFDGHPTPCEMCEAAVKTGVSAFAVTDHYDVDYILAGLYPDYDVQGARHAIEKAAEAYAGRVEIIRGIELGQPDLCPAEAAAFLRENAFDFVIGSCHNLPGVPDFYFIRFDDMPENQIKYLFRQSLLQLQKTARFPGVHTIAHPIYPLRYILRGGRTLDLCEFESDFRTLFGIMRETGTALELNMKALRTGGEPFEAEEYVFRLWYDTGGRRVTCGSDAHRAEEIGVMIPEAYARLSAIGFTEVLIPAQGGPRAVVLL